MIDGVRERMRRVVLPEINLLVRVTVGSSADPDDPPIAVDVPSRVEDVRPGKGGSKPVPTLIYIAVPNYGGDVEVPEPGTAFSIGWLTPNGVFELPAAFHGRESVGPTVRAWRLGVSGPALRAQRRRFVRVPWTAPLTVQVGERTVSGRTIDLSEGGVRCLLPPPALTRSTPVRVTLTYPDRTMILDAEVIRVQARVTPKGPLIETGLEFLDPDTYGDALRRLVFGEQLRVRRAGLA